MQCLRINCSLGLFIFQIRAVESPDPEAKRSVVGFQAQMKTSESCPRSVVALEGGISIQFTGSWCILVEVGREAITVGIESVVGC